MVPGIEPPACGRAYSNASRQGPARVASLQAVHDARRPQPAPVDLTIRRPAAERGSASVQLLPTGPRSHD